MRALPCLLALSALACSGREPPGIRTFDAAGIPIPDTGVSQPLTGYADVSDAPPSDAYMVAQGAVVPDFSLPDLNPASRTHGMTITPSALRPRVTAYYFANAI